LNFELGRSEVTPTDPLSVPPGHVSLGSDVPDYLPGLLERPGVRLDHVKVGLWQGVDGARREAALVPGLPVLLHGDNQVAGSGPLEPGELDALAVLVDETRTPWFSAHLEYRNQKELDGLRAGGYRDADLPRDRALERIVARVEQLGSALPVPILLENMSHWPADTRDLAADPGFITEVLAETGCDILLDLAHARVSGEILGLADEEYLLRLPLGRVVEVHVSGPRRKGAINREGAMNRAPTLRDAHEPMSEEDYSLLAWLLRRHRPQAVTLEYWKDPEEHAAQLKRLGEIVRGV
jgi:uncharacterized protein